MADGKRGSLRRKLLGAVTALLVLGFGAILTIDLTRHKQKALGGLDSVVTDLAAVQAGSLALPLWDYDDTRAAAQLDAFVQRSDIVSATLTEAGGEPFSEARRAADAETLKTLAIPVIHPEEGEIGTLAVAYTQDRVRAQLRREIASHSALLASVGMALLLALALALRGPLAAIDRLTGRMNAIAQGDLSVEVEESGRRDEIGRMAASLEVFRENARRIEALDAEKARAAAQAAEDRRAMMAQLRDAFGAVVDAARAGDFSRRIDARFDDPELSALAESVNSLVETVQNGLTETGRVIAGLADGDLQSRMRWEGDGAFGALRDNMNAMVARLASLVEEIQSGSEEMKRESGRIASGARDLSGRTEVQASSLRQTAAAMEQMSATVRNNAASAANADALASGAARIATDGGAVARDAIEAMGKIEGSAQKIHEIITMVDSIAFQTNLLALNAAVEAARAGSAGQGFAVVAQEVRTLAQRAADAARDVSQLVTETTQQIASGVGLVENTGGALDEIRAEIDKLAEAIGGIASATSEQAASVQEITGAIGGLDDETRRNASLALESAESAGAMTERSDRLLETASFFRLRQGAPGALFAPPPASADPGWQAARSRSAM